MEPFDLRLWPAFAAAGGDISSAAIIDSVSIDSRRIDTPHALFIPLPGKSNDGHFFVESAAKAGARYALVKAEWRPSAHLENITLLRVEDPLQAFQALAKLYRRQRTSTKVIGVTGSYGKTMLKDLLHVLLSMGKKTASSPDSFNSQIGVPLSLFTIAQQDEMAIIEAGISMPDEMRLLGSMIEPNCAIITTIGNAHAATLKNTYTIAKEKSQLLFAVPTPEWCIAPQDPLLQPHLNRFEGSCHFWNVPSPTLPHARLVHTEISASMPYALAFPDGKLHYGKITREFCYFLDLLNIAVKAAWLLGIESDKICQALQNYLPEPMRTEIWKSPLGTTFINDTCCSDPQSVELSLKHFERASLQNRKVFVFGGLRAGQPYKASDYRRIGKSIHSAGVDQVVLFNQPNYAPLIEELQRRSPQTAIALCSTYQEAVAEMKNLLGQNDIVLIKGTQKEPLDSLTRTFNESMSNNYCTINLEAIQANLETLRRKLGEGGRLMVMVKALAYGTDDISMAKFLSAFGIDILGVAYVDEGVALKRSGAKQDIFVLNAAPYEIPKVVKWQLEVGVGDLQTVIGLGEQAQRHNKQLKVHLHVDTGMRRFGCRPENALEIAKSISLHPHLKLEGIFTHLACSESPQDDHFTHAQIRSLDQVIGELTSAGLTIPWRHAANSGGLMRFDLPQYNMARVGLATYGLYPSEAAKHSLELRLALSLVSRIVAINLCKKGESISYGSTYIAQRNLERIAVLPIGYFDGLHRNYSGKSHVTIRGHKAPMVGKITMDFMMVDITDIPSAEIGDTALIFGYDEYGHYLSPEDLAASGSSIVYELITCLGPRIQRIFINH